MKGADRDVPGEAQLDASAPEKPPTTLEDGTTMHNCRFCSSSSKHKHHMKAHELVRGGCGALLA